MPITFDEQPVLIWSPTQNKWISTLLYFVDQPATTTNILDIDPGYNPPENSGSPGPQGIPGLQGEQGIPGPQGIPGTSGDGYIALSTNFEPTSGYLEILPSGSIFPTSETWYMDSTKTQKILAKNITWSGVVPSDILYTFYASDGITILQEIRDEISYVNNIFIANITRSIL